MSVPGNHKMANEPWGVPSASAAQPRGRNHIGEMRSAGVGCVLPRDGMMLPKWPGGGQGRVVLSST